MIWGRKLQESGPGNAKRLISKIVKKVKAYFKDMGEFEQNQPYPLAPFAGKLQKP
jgi:hypothetical protein